jgi:hypothetical protein
VKRQAPPNLDRSIRSAFLTFADEVLGAQWRGREREAISLYAFRYLLPHFNGRFPFHSPAQMGIEVCVPGIPGENPKGRVNKDLVIWPFSAMSCWDQSWQPVNVPRCLFEWTYSRTGTRWKAAWEYDIRWLQAFTRPRKGCVGYAVALITAPVAPRLQVARIQQGKTNRAWLLVDPNGAA